MLARLPRSAVRSGAPLVAGLLVLAVALAAPAAPPSTQPVTGLRKNPPTLHALTGARVVVAPGRVLEGATVVVADGLIAGVGLDVEIPPNARIWDLNGKTVYPGLIDAYTTTPVAKQSDDGGVPYWNPLVRPERDVDDHYQIDQKLNETFRSQGVTCRLVVPAAGVIKGTSAIVSTADDERHRAVIEPQVALHMRLTINARPFRKSFPNSPMGAVALARQAMYDADWYRRAWQVYRADRGLPRPERNQALERLQAYVDSDRLVMIDASNAQFFLRADRFAREFALNIAIRGAGDEYRRLDAIRDSGRAVVLPLNFRKPPNVRTPEAAYNVALRDLMHWDHAPENPARLAAAGVRIAFCSHGLKKQGDFLSRLRTVVHRGLPADDALRALTTTPAKLFGVDDRLGTLEVGKVANFLIADGDLFAKKTKILETWVDGRRYEVTPKPYVDLRRTWRVTVDGDKPLVLLVKLRGEPTKLRGTIRSQPKDEADDKQPPDPTKLKRVQLDGSRLSCTFDSKVAGKEGRAQLSAVVAADGTWLGTVHWPDGSTSSLTAKPAKLAKPEDNKDEEDEDKDEDEADEDEKDTEPPIDLTASSPVNYPLGACGRSAPPEQPELLVFRNATVWTCEPGGVLEDASVLIGGGKILAVGKQLDVPEGAVVVDATGKHITPGIIDCHSHMATDGGINESSQAITAEVRIGDFVDASDMNIYRQLAGGVTAANILHGSANPIGGQNQVIKLRWGALDEELKFAQAPQGIKFALGENVKQSNWGDKFTSRYPQTRMGVEQIVRDAFQTAQQYDRRWQAWRRTRQGLPPRRDLELDALLEILQHKRWIHCHSYRQDEILALLRTLEDFDVQIGTLQHILEGYKIADAMARHGAMGSAFSDWWAYKFEVYDAIPYNGALMHRAGVVVSFNSDDQELARHLNQEAAKAIKYGGLAPQEALKFVTLNPARQLRIDQYVGSLKPGKHADLVVWNGPPLSNLTRCEQTWVDGRKYFDLQEDARQRQEGRKLRAALVQKILTSGQKMIEPDEQTISPSQLWPREDIFCHRHDHNH